MDLELTKFGRGPRELGGAVDLINQYKLWPHHYFFCKRSLPLSISETQYLHNVVGETEIRKGEEMKLGQLFPNASYVGDRNVHIHPFDMDILREAFQMRETSPIDLPCTEKGIPTTMLKSNGVSKDEKKHKKQKNRDKEKDREKHKRRHKGTSRDKEKIINGHHYFGHEHLKNQQNKKRMNGGSDYFSGIQKRQKSEVTSATGNNSEINETSMLRIAR